MSSHSLVLHKLSYFICHHDENSLLCLKISHSLLSQPNSLSIKSHYFHIWEFKINLLTHLYFTYFILKKLNNFQKNFVHKCFYIPKIFLFSFSLFSFDPPKHAQMKICITLKTFICVFDSPIKKIIFVFWLFNIESSLLLPSNNSMKSSSIMWKIFKNSIKKDDKKGGVDRSSTVIQKDPEGNKSTHSIYTQINIENKTKLLRLKFFH